MKNLQKTPVTLAQDALAFSLIRAVLGGAWRFAMVSIAGFSVWAFAGKWFRGHGGEVVLYAASTVIFISVAGLLMYPLIRGPQPLIRFYNIFVPAFLVYGCVWSVFWFLLRFGAGEWLASLAGSVCFVTVCAWRFGNMRPVTGAALVFFVTHSVGYFAGGKLMAFLMSPGTAHVLAGLSKSQCLTLAELSWGLLYGLGFGAGLGYLLHVLQATAKPSPADAESMLHS